MELTLAHWFYFIGTLLIIGTMLFKKNVVLPSIMVTFVVAWSFTGSFISGLQSTFRASLVAASSLFDIFLIIAVMTALLHSLRALGADKKMITPFQKVMVNGHISYWILIIVTYAISLFFWPTPAVPLVGAILIPAAIRAGLSPLGAGVAIALAGQGMALSSDYIIQIAPTLSATPSGLDVGLVADQALLLSLITGFISIGMGYLIIRKSIKAPADAHLIAWEKERLEENRENEIMKVQERGSTSSQQKGIIFAILVPTTFLFLVGYMLYAKLTGSSVIQGGDGAALIGGAAFLLLVAASLTNHVKGALEEVSKHIIDGLLFAFRAMGIVLPIAGFFFLGNDETAAQILVTAKDVPAFLFDLIVASEHLIPNNAFLAAFGMLIIGMITGLDGSGFSGLPLTGALAGPLGTSMGMDPVTLAAIGQMGAIWVGGGTLIAWSSLVAVAGFAKVPVMDLVRQNFIPVFVGLLVSTLCAILFL